MYIHISEFFKEILLIIFNVCLYLKLFSVGIFLTVIVYILAFKKISVWSLKFKYFVFRFIPAFDHWLLSIKFWTRYVKIFENRKIVQWCNRSIFILGLSLNNFLRLFSPGIFRSISGTFLFININILKPFLLKWKNNLSF